MEFFSIPSYHAYLSPAFAKKLLDGTKPHSEIAELLICETSHKSDGSLETPEALRFLLELYERIEADLRSVLAQRKADRKFIDERTRACTEFNNTLGRDLNDFDYKTVIGLQDAQGRTVFGPLGHHYCETGGRKVAPLPSFLQGPHVTLFGPPDSAKLAINAMNSLHRKLPDEPPIVEELVQSQSHVPFWGADDEDSKTPLHQDLLEAAENLTACFEGSLSLNEGTKTYALAPEKLALPIKRIPGLALPTAFLFYKRSPIPLHLYDFALHFFRNYKNPKALVFYIPKLENEEEAAYLYKMLATAEEMIQKRDSSYKLGTIRLMIVLENPRAILRTHEIIDALYPYFAGASLGWHDYLASMARLAREDSNYRIPVKADPNIVIKHIHASQILLAKVVGSRGGIKVGGMYGILPVGSSPESLQVTLKGFIKDVISQMKRELNGFWVAHPDFVRIGIALVEAWRRYTAGDKQTLFILVNSILDQKYHAEIKAFIENPDIQGLSTDDPKYLRSLIVTNIKQSDFIANNHPEEVRYNVFQSLQYLTDWLSGNGCVALPTVVEGTAVRVMDDLATAERSRWEVWHEIRHGRFSVEDLIRIAHEEMNFIRRDLSHAQKTVQVKWDTRTEKWYPIALKIMLQLMTDPEPVEFATELLLPFTTDPVRSSPDPWSQIKKLDPNKYRLPKYVADYEHYFEICGSHAFAHTMALNPLEDSLLARKIIENFTIDQVLSAAGFHGDIGQNKKTLDSRAMAEQSLVLKDSDALQRELRDAGELYLKQFGFKFLISAQGRTGSELLSELKRRLNNSPETELNNAREALWLISQKRMTTPENPSLRDTRSRLEALRIKYKITGASIAINYCENTQTLNLGESELNKSPVTDQTLFEIASLSKTVGSAFAIEYFNSRGISLQTPVNDLFGKTHSKFRLSTNDVTLEHLMSHSALNTHYVPGLPPQNDFPPLVELLEGKHGYTPIEVINPPGTVFQYSGGGFIVLELLLEVLESKPFKQLIEPYLDRLGLSEMIFDHSPSAELQAHGYMDDGNRVPGGHLCFPLIAAGAWSTSSALARFLRHLTRAFREIQSVAIPHDTAVQMLTGTDRGCRDFMGCDMGVGVFTIQAGPNRFALHQGANEGFRSIFLQCTSGPDFGKGLVVLCNGDNRGVLFISEVVKEILGQLGCQGIDLSRLQSGFDYQGLPQEQIVNLGYKKLIFEAFEPDLPEEILRRGPVDPLSKDNLAVGARILEVSNQKFARAENCLSAHLPSFDPVLFGRQGKIMDSWETARHNPLGYETLEFELKKPSPIQYVSISTQFHDGNHFESVQLEGNPQNTDDWVMILPKTPLLGHSMLCIDLGPSQIVFQRVRITAFPDGGLTRLGLYRHLPPEHARSFTKVGTAKPARFKDPIPKAMKPLCIAYNEKPEAISENRTRAKAIDPASAAFGGQVIHASNEHYGPAAQVISPYPPLHMFDGLESARSRKPGHHEEVTLRLGTPTLVGKITLDFKYFVNNNPLEISIDGFSSGKWEKISARTRVKAFAGNQKQFLFSTPKVYEELRVKVFPDGGINRIRVNL